MKNVKLISANEYDLEVEHKIQILTKQAYITQTDLANVVGCSNSTIKKKLEEYGIELTCFGYPTSKVIRKLELGPYLDNLIKMRNGIKKRTHS